MRRTAAILLIAVTALVPLACGGSDDSSGSEAEPTTGAADRAESTAAMEDGTAGEGEDLDVGNDTLATAIRSGLEATGLEVTDIVVADDVATVTLASATTSQRAVACSAVGSFVGTTILVVDGDEEEC